jgi:hypothetical protein
MDWAGIVIRIIMERSKGATAFKQNTGSWKAGFGMVLANDLMLVENKKTRSSS